MRCGCLGWFESTMLFDALYFISTIVIIKLSKRSGRRCLYAEKNKEYIERIRTMYEKCVQRRFLQNSCIWFLRQRRLQRKLDVMILVNTPLEKINSYYDQVSDCAFDFMMKYGVDISPVIKNVEHFNYWKDDLPYYHNVLKEGVAV